MAEQSSSIDQDKAESSGGLTIQRSLIIGLGVLIGAIIIGLIIAVVGALINSDGIANFFRILRDFFIIVLALQGILISVALVVLVLQVTALVNLLSTEIKPIIDETREAMSTIRGTAEFVSKNVARPVIRASAVVAGARALLGELTGLRQSTAKRVPSSTSKIPAKKGKSELL